MRSGGYSLSERVKDIKQSTLIIWARNDEILDPEFADRFNTEITNSKLVYIEDCGHLGVLERPTDMAQAVFNFMGIA